MRCFLLFSFLLGLLHAAQSETLDDANHCDSTKERIFSAKQRAYLKEKKVIRYCTQPDSLPYSSIEKGKFIGIGAGIIDLASKKSGIAFRLVPAKTWKESITKAVHRECDILPIASDAPSRRKYFSFTHSYYKEPLVLVTAKKTKYILNLDTILDKKFVAIGGHSYIEQLKQRYPEIRVDSVKTAQEGLALVESGKYYGYIDVLMSAAYAMQKGSMLNLKIATQFDMGIAVSFGVRNDDAMLLSIMDTIAKDISKGELQGIINRWISVNYTEPPGFKYLKELLFGIGIVLLLILFRAYLLKRKNRELELLKEELVLLNEKLESKAYTAILDLEKAQEIAKVGSWILHIPEEDLHWSKETYRMFGFAPDSVANLYEQFQASIHPDDVQLVFDAFEKALKDREEYICPHRIVLPNAEIKYVNERARITFGTAGNPLIAYGTVQDVTEIVLKERALKERDMFLLQQSRLAQMGEMLSMIAHQWKQPLSSIAATEIMIKTVVELEKYDLAQESEREEFTTFLMERLEKIALYVQNLSQTISNFSQFYKPNSASEHLSVDSAIKKADALIAESMQANTIALVYDLHADIKIDMHENEFMQVILNLITNAKEQLLEQQIAEAKIVVRTYSDNQSIVIEVEDNGGGIDASIIKKVFNPYFSTKLEKNGTGLGLYMSQMIIKKYHNGKIAVKNTKEGACFSIRLELNGGGLIDEV